MNKIRTLIVDDEPLAREGVMAMLAADPEIEVVGTCGDGQSAVVAIRSLQPDLVFLDVQMPKRDGFEVLADLKREERPVVIFVTAYDKYAIKAFDIHAIDYLLKPFRDARFVAALTRAKREIQQSRVLGIGQKVEQLLSYVHEVIQKGDIPRPAGTPIALAAEPADRVVLKTGSDLHFIKTADIIWVESQADFVKVHTTGSAQLVRETLQSLEQRVDPAKFLRIHRSSLVNLEHVKKVTPALYGDYTVLMSDDSKLRLSRKNRGKLKQLIARLSTLESG
ncbi:MAG: Two component transcriptional regulator, LytTR family [Lacunisphaera sp.]|nr:Two component transcriptional regulator, LytTR family [Lacunisphaera sp.]